MPPKTSSMYPSSISRALCSDGMRCIKPLAPSRNETNSSRVNGGADGAILGICSYGGRDQGMMVFHTSVQNQKHWFSGAGCSFAYLGGLSSLSNQPEASDFSGSTLT